MIMDKSILDYADYLTGNGLFVYFPAKPTTYFYFTDGINIGYCQYDRYAGFSFSSEHQPCKQCGTGFVVSEHIGEPKVYHALESFHRPQWANCYTIKKYKDFGEFASKHWQSLFLHPVN